MHTQECFNFVYRFKSLDINKLDYFFVFWVLGTTNVPTYFL